MDGIWAVWRLDGISSEQDNDNMAAVMARRGSAIGASIDRPMGGGVALGQRFNPRGIRTDAAPYTDGRCTIVLDGRLDNRDGLREQLERDGVMLLPDSADDALMLATYRAWGEAAFESWLGDFAVILWDSAERRLLCVRDQMGVKPLFYVHMANVFAAASEVRALLTLPDVSRRVDETMLSLYLSTADFGDDDKARTFYYDIKRVVNGQFVRVNLDEGRLSAQSKTYWRLNPDAETRYINDEDYAHAFRAILEDATRVRRAGWSESEIGAALSGGMDSSSVVCLLREIGGGSFHTFYMQPEIASADESRYVDDVLNHTEPYGSVFHHRASVPSVFSGGASIYDVLDMPTYWFNLPLSLAMYRMASDLGIRAFFDGMDGDMVISYGRRGLTEILARGERERFKVEAVALAQSQHQNPRDVMSKYAFPYIDHLARRGRWGGVGQSIRALGADFRMSPLNLGVYWARNYFIPERFTRAAQGLRRREPLRLQRWQQDNPMLKPDFVRRNDLEARLRAANQSIPPLNARDEHARIINNGRLALAFEDANLVGTAHGITLLHILSDRRVLEFCYGLPVEQRLRNGLSRWILRAALRDLLPPSIAERGDKTDFGAAFIHTMRTHDLPFLEALFSDLDAVSPYVEPDAVRGAYRAFRSGGAMSSPRATMLIRIARLSLWLNHVGK